jgi:hypothetical protein
MMHLPRQFQEPASGIPVWCNGERLLADRLSRLRASRYRDFALRPRDPSRGRGANSFLSSA